MQNLINAIFGETVGKILAPEVAKLSPEQKENILAGICDSVSAEVGAIDVDNPDELVSAMTEHFCTLIPELAEKFKGELNESH